jgi:hypothetical protein
MAFASSACERPCLHRFTTPTLLRFTVLARRYHCSYISRSHHNFPLPCDAFQLDWRCFTVWIAVNTTVDNRGSSSPQSLESAQITALMDAGVLGPQGGISWSILRHPAQHTARDGQAWRHSLSLPANVRAHQQEKRPASLCVYKGVLWAL